MSRTTLLGPFVLLALLVLAVPTGAVARDGGLPHALPTAAGAHAARAAAPLPARWLIAARPSAATARIASAHGALALALRGVYAVATPRARAFARALGGLLRFSEPDRALRRASAYEGPGTDPAGWARGAVVAPGLVAPAAFAPIGIVDDVVDTRVVDVGQAKVLAASPTKALDEAGGAVVAHGTEVASVAAGRADGEGVIGIAPGAPLLSYGYKELSCAEAADGILALVDAGAEVINLSFDADEDCHTLELATAAAFGDGALIVAAAGNELRRGHDPTVYPAAYPHVVTVGALDLGLAHAGFSSTGPGLDLAAPGEAVPVAVPPALDLDGTADGTTRQDGTSFAAPIVSGVASWLIAARPRLAAGQYAGILRASAKDLGTPGWDAGTGFGLVDLAAALAAPAPAADRGEPNDGIDHVDGTAFSRPDAYVKGTVKASVDPAEDPVDVYRVRLAARGRVTARLTPSAAGNTDLYAYSGSVKSLAAAPLSRSRKAGRASDVLHLRNSTNKPRTLYVVVRAPATRQRTLTTPYVLRLSAG
jgi:hypothetical protein